MLDDCPAESRCHPQQSPEVGSVVGPPLSELAVGARLGALRRPVAAGQGWVNYVHQSVAVNAAGPGHAGKLDVPPPLASSGEQVVIGVATRENSSTVCADAR